MNPHSSPPLLSSNPPLTAPHLESSVPLSSSSETAKSHFPPLPSSTPPSSSSNNPESSTSHAQSFPLPNPPFFPASSSISLPPSSSSFSSSSSSSLPPSSSCSSPPSYSSPPTLRLRRLLNSLDTQRTIKTIGRWMVCFFFINQVYEQVESYIHFHRDPPVRVNRWAGTVLDPDFVAAQEGARMGGGTGGGGGGKGGAKGGMAETAAAAAAAATAKIIQKAVEAAGFEATPFPTSYLTSFPYLNVLLVLPSAILCGFDILAPSTSLILLISVLYDDARLTWTQIINVVRYGKRPTELLFKRMGVAGAALMVVIHAFIRFPQTRVLLNRLTGWWIHGSSSSAPSRRPFGSHLDLEESDEDDGEEEEEEERRERWDRRGGEGTFPGGRERSLFGLYNKGGERGHFSFRAENGQSMTRKSLPNISFTSSSSASFSALPPTAGSHSSFPSSPFPPDICPSGSGIDVVGSASPYVLYGSTDPLRVHDSHPSTAEIKKKRKPSASLSSSSASLPVASAATSSFDAVQRVRRRRRLLRRQWGRSTALLVVRLCLACLFFCAGLNQVWRIASRGGALWERPAATPRDLVKPIAGSEGGRRGGEGTQASIVKIVHHYGIPDSHDNNWVLMEMILCLPFVVGWRTGLVCRLLTAVLILEALCSWPWWAWYWPSWHYRAHVRSHWATNIAAAGGLLLLQALGPGAYSIDAVAKKD